jgi:glycopeptide antibiotics resistance protein
MFDMTSATRPPKSRIREWFAAVGLAICVGIVLFATMWPAPLDQGYASAIGRFLEILHKYGVPVWFGYNKLEFSANILMFVPLGFLLTMLLPTRWWWLAVFICPALSIGIELTQAAALSARFATVSDVIANSSGAVVGIFFAVAIRAVVHARDAKVIDRALWQLTQRR